MTEYAEPAPGIITLPLLDRPSCREILARAEEQDAWKPAGVINRNGHGETLVKPEVRSATYHVFGQDTETGLLLHRRIEETVRPLVRSVWQKDLADHTPFQVVRYRPGGFYRAHRDTGPHTASRYFSVVCYLNDDFEGGGTYFSAADYTVVPEQGKAVIFPSDYLHQGMPVHSGTKYIAVTWMLGPPPIDWI